MKNRKEPKTSAEILRISENDALSSLSQLPQLSELIQLYFFVVCFLLFFLGSILQSDMMKINFIFV